MPEPESPSSLPTILLLSDPSHAGHAWPGHVERPERITPVLDGVRAAGATAGVALVEATAPAATPELAASVHDAGYVEWLSRTKETGFLDPDTYLADGSPTAAFAAAGQSVAAARAVLDRDARVAVAAVRPPGHHAGRFGGRGFCLLNNVALAVAAARSADPTLRVAVLDWDLHHGNGSQELFAPDDAAFYASTHQFPFYPGTGSAAEQGERLVNVPLPEGSCDHEFIDAWTESILPRAEAFGPELILISAGFDAHRSDPLSGLEVTEAAFGQVAQAVGQLAHRLDLEGVALSLEGGYDLDALRASTRATVTGLLAGLSGSPVGESHI